MRSKDQAPRGDSEDIDSRVAAHLRVVASREAKKREPTDEEQDGEYNLRILQPAFRYIRDRHGEELLGEIFRGSGLPTETMLSTSAWISHDHFEHLMAAIREVTSSDEEFMRACVHELKKQYGAFILMFRVMSVRQSYEMMARTGGMVCKVGRFKVVDGSRTSARIVYTTERPESRLTCLSRQSQLMALPTMFLGVSPATLREHSCVAYGDSRCEYELHWYEPLRLRWILGGAAIGGLLASLLPSFLGDPTAAYITLPIVGAMTGVFFEMRRLIDEHLRFAAKTTIEMERVIRSHAQAMDELAALQDRERDWSRRVEQGVASRTKKLNLVVRRLHFALQRRTGKFPAVTDGLETPLNTLTSLADSLEHGSPPTGTPKEMQAIETAVNRVSRLVGELVDIARDDPTQQALLTERIEVDDLVVRVRQQLKATMMGRDVRITVFQTREAPEYVISVRSMLERVVDNLLFNATRHTDRGSIVAEIGGTPGSLLLKVSDTGLGVSKERLEQVFGNEDGARGMSEHGASLSSTARLLDRLGGRLEIMSEPEVGTTLWVYVPIEPAATTNDDDGRKQLAPSEQDGLDPDDTMVGRVVTIRSRNSSSDV